MSAVAQSRVHPAASGTGPTVLLLHAFPLDGGMWDDVALPLADAGWDVVVPDLRGFGQSRYGADGPDDEPSLTAMADDALAILDRLGVASAVVCGLSLGGYVAMELLRQEPARVAALVLADTKATADDPDARANRLRIADQVLAAGSTAALARAMITNLLGTSTHAEQPDLVDRVRRTIEEADPAAVAWTQRAMAARPDSCEQLAAYVRPALVLWGEEDVISGREEQDLMVAALPDSRLAVVARAGHLSALERPREVVAELLAFLREVRQSAMGG